MPSSSTHLSSRELAAWKGFLSAHSGIVGRLDADLRERFGLPLTSYEVLIYLADAPGHRLRMSELAGELLLSRSGLTRLVDRLERDGLVRRERCDDDGRGYFAVLSEAGDQLLAQARPAHLRAVREQFVEKLDPAELEALAAIWAKLGA